MNLKMKRPAAWDKANGAAVEADNFYRQDYPNCERFATDFEHVAVVARRVARLVARHGLTAERAALAAPLVFGEGRA